LSSTTENVDLIYNGLSDKYETLYPYIEDANNEGGLTLLSKEALGDKQVNKRIYKKNGIIKPALYCIKQKQHILQN
jgi:hypothetical protein